MLVTEEHIADAFGRLNTIAAVHSEVENPFEQYEAVKAYMEYLGLDDHARKELIEQVLSFVPLDFARARGWVMLGFLAGLTASVEAEPD